MTLMHCISIEHSSVNMCGSFSLAWMMHVGTFDALPGIMNFSRLIDIAVMFEIKTKNGYPGRICMRPPPLKEHRCSKTFPWTSAIMIPAL